MRKIWILFLLGIILAESCITRQKCYERFPPETKDSLITVITYKDTVIHDTVLVPGKSIAIYDTLPCPELNYYKEIKKDGLKHTVDIKNGVLNSDCKVDSLLLVIDNLIKQKQTLIKDKSSQTTTVKVNELTKVQNFLIFCGWLFWILILLLIIYIILRIYFKVI